MAPAARIAGAILLAAVQLACFEDPIEERCVLRFEPGGELRVTYDVEVRRAVGGTRPFDDRLAALEEELLGGWSPWLQRLERAGGQREGLSWERWEGHLVRFERWIELGEPERQLAELFGDTPIAASLVLGGEVEGSAEAAAGLQELTLLAGASDRAGREERERVERELERWADELGEHLAATAELWRYVEANPARAQPVVEGLFADLLEPRRRERIELMAAEEPLVARALEVQQRLVEIFDFPEDEAFTLQETSRRVFDPFPAAFVVELAEGSRLVEHEGFELDDEGRLLVPRVSFWDAFESLAGRWAWPDPLVAQAHHLLRDPDAPFAVDAFLDQEFGYAVVTPRGTEVAAELRRALRPREVFRAVWQAPRAETAESGPDALEER